MPATAARPLLAAGAVDLRTFTDITSGSGSAAFDWAAFPPSFSSTAVTKEDETAERNQNVRQTSAKEHWRHGANIGFFSPPPPKQKRRTLTSRRRSIDRSCSRWRSTAWSASKFCHLSQNVARQDHAVRACLLHLWGSGSLFPHETEVSTSASARSVVAEMKMQKDLFVAILKYGNVLHEKYYLNDPMMDRGR